MINLSPHDKTLGLISLVCVWGGIGIRKKMEARHRERGRRAKGGARGEEIHNA